MFSIMHHYMYKMECSGTTKVHLTLLVSLLKLSVGDGLAHPILFLQCLNEIAHYCDNPPLQIHSPQHEEDTSIFQTRHHRFWCILHLDCSRCACICYLTSAGDPECNILAGLPPTQFLPHYSALPRDHASCSPYSDWFRTWSTYPPTMLFYHQLVERAHIDIIIPCSD